MVFGGSHRGDGTTWLRAKNRNPKRVIAALEKLASLIALKLWGTEKDSDIRIHAEAFTDNKGNEFILKKGMSTKYPITLLVIEVSETLRLQTQEQIWFG